MDRSTFIFSLFPSYKIMLEIFLMENIEIRYANAWESETFMLIPTTPSRDQRLEKLWKGRMRPSLEETLKFAFFSRLHWFSCPPINPPDKQRPQKESFEGSQGRWHRSSSRNVQHWSETIVIAFTSNCVAFVNTSFNRRRALLWCL